MQVSPRFLFAPERGFCESLGITWGSAESSSVFSLPSSRSIISHWPTWMTARSFSLNLITHCFNYYLPAHLISEWIIATGYKTAKQIQRLRMISGLFHLHLQCSYGAPCPGGKSLAANGWCFCSQAECFLGWFWKRNKLLNRLGGVHLLPHQTWVQRGWCSPCRGSAARRAALSHSRYR